MEIPVSFSADELIQKHTNKSIRFLLITLAIPIGMLLVSVAVVRILAVPMWKFANDLFPISLNTLAEYPLEFAIGIATLLVGLILIIFSFAFTLRVSRIERRSLRKARKPAIEDFGVVEGLHFGEGVVKASKEGFTFNRSLFSETTKWEAVSSVDQTDNKLSIVGADGTIVYLGETSDEELAVSFVEYLKPFLNRE